MGTADCSGCINKPGAISVPSPERRISRLLDEVWHQQITHSSSVSCTNSKPTHCPHHYQTQRTASHRGGCGGAWGQPGGKCHWHCPVIHRCSETSCKRPFLPPNCVENVCLNVATGAGGDAGRRVRLTKPAEPRRRVTCVYNTVLRRYGAQRCW